MSFLGRAPVALFRSARVVLSAAASLAATPFAGALRGVAASPTLTGTLLAPAVLGAAVGACRHDEPAGSSAAKGIARLESLSVVLEPPTATLALGGTARTRARVLARTLDGAESDVTDQVSLTVTPSRGVTLQGAELETRAPGWFSVAARANGDDGAPRVGLATYRVRLAGTLPSSKLSEAEVRGLDRAPSTTDLSISYPLPGALIPIDLGPPTFQVAAPASLTAARVFVRGDAIDLAVDLRCSTVAVGTAVLGCELQLPASLGASLAGASEAPNLEVRVRLTDGLGVVRETKPLDVRWTRARLLGGIYYWRSNGRQDQSKFTEIARLDLEKPEAPSEAYWNQPRDTGAHPLVAAPWPGALARDIETPCIGCHAVSADGSKLAFTVGGSDAAAFGMLDVERRALVDFVPADGLSGAGFAQFTAFDPTGEYLIQAHDGILTVRRAQPGFATVRTVTFNGLRALSQPFWGERELVFVSYVDPGRFANADLVTGAGVYITAAERDRFAQAPRELVAPNVEETHYFPSLSPDGEWVSFVTSRCGGPNSDAPYGEAPCDGYDDPTARVRLVRASGGPVLELPRLNSAGLAASAAVTNSWPRFSPLDSAESFRGDPVVWVAFSSRRPYGLRMNAQSATATPQIWFSAIVIPTTGVKAGEDPSFAPVWLPRQNASDAKPTGNHLPQWTTRIIGPAP